MKISKDLKLYNKLKMSFVLVLTTNVPFLKEENAEKSKLYLTEKQSQ